eukprot:TRINITY_DN8187_c0_g1_i1.p1 TRINITY_DN8187_c0_g1~~TRINITY_DN8187_c0_g1_i1.p1  ORF type:complete len:400 (+),score=41.27 TRINITY_DN8187_c0_g1_i1:2-1201(+)
MDESSSIESDPFVENQHPMDSSIGSHPYDSIPTFLVTNLVPNFNRPLPIHRLVMYAMWQQWRKGLSISALVLDCIDVKDLDEFTRRCTGVLSQWRLPQSKRAHPSDTSLLDSFWNSGKEGLKHYSTSHYRRLKWISKSLEDTCRNIYSMLPDTTLHDFDDSPLVPKKMISEPSLPEESDCPCSSIKPLVNGDTLSTSDHISMLHSDVWKLLMRQTDIRRHIDSLNAVPMPEVPAESASPKQKRSRTTSPTTVRFNISDAQVSPLQILRELDHIFHFDDEACITSSDPSKIINGLDRRWGSFVWCDPPPSDIPRWIKKAIQQVELGSIVVMLLPVSSTSRYWQDMILPNASGMWFLPRITFHNPNPFPISYCVVIFTSDVREIAYPQKESLLGRYISLRS